MFFIPMLIGPTVVIFSLCIYSYLFIDEVMDVTTLICKRCYGTILSLLQKKPAIIFSRKRLLKAIEHGRSHFIFINLSRLNLRGLKFIGHDFTASLLNRIKAQGANFSDARMKFVKMNFAQLAECHFEHADLQYAELEQVNLQNANLADANLKGANLARANLCGANLSNVNIQKVSFKGAFFNDETMLPFSWMEAFKEEMAYVA